MGGCSPRGYVRGEHAPRGRISGTNRPTILGYQPDGEADVLRQGMRPLVIVYVKAADGPGMAYGAKHHKDFLYQCAQLGLETRRVSGDRVVYEVTGQSEALVSLLSGERRCIVDWHLPVSVQRRSSDATAHEREFGGWVGKGAAGKHVMRRTPRPEPPPRDRD